ASPRTARAPPVLPPYDCQKRHREVVKDVDALQGIVRAYWSAFGNQDSDGDIIEKGAYAKTIRERGPQGSDRIQFLYQHETKMLIGRPLEMVEDDHGLLVTAKVSKTVLGRDVLTLYEDGVLREHSVGIDVLLRRDAARERIAEVRLWEGSPVTWGANPLTPTVDVKALKQGLDDLHALRKTVRGPLSDEMAQTMEARLADLESRLLALKDALLSGD